MAKFPVKVKRFISKGELDGLEQDTDDILESCANALDGCESHEILGTVLFEGAPPLPEKELRKAVLVSAPRLLGIVRTRPGPKALEASSAALTALIGTIFFVVCLSWRVWSLWPPAPTPALPSGWAACRRPRAWSPHRARPSPTRTSGRWSSWSCK